MSYDEPLQVSIDASHMEAFREPAPRQLTEQQVDKIAPRLGVPRQEVINLTANNE